jgi:hypothetical protein
MMSESKIEYPYHSAMCAARSWVPTVGATGCGQKMRRMSRAANFLPALVKLAPGHRDELVKDLNRQCPSRDQQSFGHLTARIVLAGGVWDDVLVSKSGLSFINLFALDSEIWREAPLHLTELLERPLFGWSRATLKSRLPAMEISISSPSLRSRASTTAAGSRTAKLLPHLETCITDILVYPCKLGSNPCPAPLSTAPTLPASRRICKPQSGRRWERWS